MALGLGTAPLADLVGLSRQGSVLAYQTGAALSDGWIPTNGALLAMLVAAQVPYGRWLRFVVPGLLLVSIVGFVGMALAYRAESNQRSLGDEPSPSPPTRAGRCPGGRLRRPLRPGDLLGPDARRLKAQSVGW